MRRLRLSGGGAAIPGLLLLGFLTGHDGDAGNHIAFVEIDALDSEGGPALRVPDLVDVQLDQLSLSGNQHYAGVLLHVAGVDHLAVLLPHPDIDHSGSAAPLTRVLIHRGSLAEALFRDGKELPIAA